MCRAHTKFHPLAYYILLSQGFKLYQWFSRESLIADSIYDISMEVFRDFVRAETTFSRVKFNTQLTPP